MNLQLYNIIIFPGWFPTKSHPLKAIFTKKHIDLISKDHNVCVAYAEQSSNLKKNFEIQIDRSNTYPIIVCFYERSNQYFFKKGINFLRSLIAYWRAFAVAKQNLGRIDFIHIHVLTRDALIPLYFKIFKKIPFYISEHSTAYIRDDVDSFLIKKLKNVLFRNSSGISTVSAALKTAIENKGISHTNFRIIHNIVNSKLFEYQPKTEEKIVKLLHVSRLDESAKNVIGILKVFEKLYHKHHYIHLDIVGGEKDVVSDAEHFSQNLSSKSNIRFHGPITTTAVIPFFNKSDYLIMFSNYETQGVVVMEALFCGIPVIATDLPCLNEYLHNGNSLIVKPLDQVSLYNAIELCVTKGYEFWSPKEISLEMNTVFDNESIKKSFQLLYNEGFKL